MDIGREGDNRVDVVARWNGRLAVALQRALRLSNEQFAAVLGRPTRTVAKWHERPDVDLREPNQQDLDTLLRRATPDAQGRFALLASQTVIAPAVASTPVEAWELTDALTRSSIGSDVLDEVERVVMGHATSYGRYPPTLMIASVERLMTRLRDALRESQSLSTHARCVGLLGVLAGVSGNLSMDLARPERAASMFKVGRLAGREAEDDDLAAWVSANQSIAAFFAGRHVEAVELLEHAESVAGRVSTPQRRSWVASMLARALAAEGQHDAARRALDRSHALMNLAEGHGRGTDFFDAPRLDGLSGSCMLLLRDSAAAVDLLSRALATRSPDDLKGRALLTLDLAECRVIDGEPEEASQLAIGALEIANGTVVRPIVERAAVLRARMSRWDGYRAVAELDARLEVTAMTID
jgi:tetratricopeptide (TPR) repeat protein